MNEDIVIPIAGMLMIICISIGVPLVVALGKKWQRDGEVPRASPEISDRLQRMEQAIDTISIEVERISESQRFLTKLLADRSREPAAVPRSTTTP